MQLKCSDQILCLDKIGALLVKTTNTNINVLNPWIDMPFNNINVTAWL